MEFHGNSIDDILIELYPTLISKGHLIRASRGETIELLSVSLHITSPRARVSLSENRGKLFSALGEFLWYLSEENNLTFIEPYIPQYRDDTDEDGKIYGGYGPRIFNAHGSINQIENVINTLRERPTSRRAVIQLFDAKDIASTHKEVPCTTTMQFFIRQEKLHMQTTLRSNDAYKGLPHDVFCFTMLQEMISRSLEIELGEYHQHVGSMHAYTSDVTRIETYLHEGYHRLEEMPPMPSGNPFLVVPQLLECERRMRADEIFDAYSVIDESYWADLICLVQAFWASGMSERLDKLSEAIRTPMYLQYLNTRRPAQRKF